MANTRSRRPWKRCSKCRVLKSVRQFYYHRCRRRRSYSCRACNAAACLRYQRRMREDPMRVLARRSGEIRYRARFRRVACARNLSEILRRLWTTQRGRCAYTGRVMTFGNYHGDRDCATVDRVDPNRGYIEGNLVLCTSLANRVKQDLTVDGLVEFCRQILAHARRRR